MSSALIDEPRSPRRLRRGGPDLARLEGELGDLAIEAELARTTTAVVYRVRTGAHGDRPLALKVALEPGDAEELARFRHEARLLSEVRHPNVVAVHDVGVLPGDFPFLTMDLVEPLEPPPEGGFAAGALYDLALDAAAGLAHIHRQGIVHLDVKPANLGRAPAEPEADGPGRLQILDFGLARDLRDPLDRRIRGTLAYTAPEVLLQDRYDPRADLYSLGVTLYELATGALPFAGAGETTDEAAIRFHLSPDVPDPRARRPDLPAPLAAIVVRLLRSDPNERYASAARLLEALGEAAARPVDAGSLAIGTGTLLASRLVGRQPELDRFARALDAVREGRGGTLVVEGAEGVGKSRLLRELRLLAAVEGAQVVTGRGTAERTQPLGPVLQALGRLGVDLSAALGTSAGEGPEDDPERQRFRLYREIGAALTRAARAGNRPLALLLDDVHHAGPETADLLAFLGRDLTRSPVLVVAARRAGELAGREAAAGDLDEEGDRLLLEPLAPEATEALVAAGLGAAAGDLPAELYAWVYRQSGGLPGEIQRLVRHLIAEGALLWRDGRWTVRLSSLGRLAEPEAVDELDRLRVEALMPAERRVMAAAVVAGQPFRLPTLAALVDGEPTEIYERLETLVALGILESWTEAEGAVYDLARRPLREEIYRGLDDEERRSLHHRLARLLEARLEAGAESLHALVAEHYWRAGEPERALPALGVAARRAAEVYGHRDAAHLHGRAAGAAAAAGDREVELEHRRAAAASLAASGETARALAAYRELLRDLPGRRVADRRRRALTGLELGRLHGRLGEHEAALEVFEGGLAVLAPMAGDAGSLELEIDLLHGKAVALRDLGRPEEAFESARAALRRAGRAGLPEQRALLLNTLARLFFARGDWPRAERLARRGVRAAALADDPRLGMVLRNTLAMARWKSGDSAAAHALYAENLVVAEHTSDPWGQLTALNNLAVLACGRGEWRSARDLLRRNLDLQHRLGAREGEMLAHVNLAEVEDVLGAWGRAAEHARRAIELAGGPGDRAARAAAHVELASLERKQGRHEAAREQLAAAEEDAAASGDRDLVAQAALEAARLEADGGRPEEAARRLASAAALADEVGTPELVARVALARAELELAAGEAESAHRAAAEAAQHLAETEDRLSTGRLQAIEARLADAAGEAGAEVDRRFAASVETLEAISAPYEAARSLYEWGLRTWNLEVALERLQRALGTFERLSARTDAERAAGAIRRVREHRRAGGAGAAGGDSALYEIIKVINSSLDLGEVLDRTLDLVLERLNAERGMVVLQEPLTRELEVAAARNIGGDGEEERQLSESVVRRVIETEEPVLAVDAPSDRRFAGAESIVASHIQSILCVPLTIRERPAGAIYLDHRRSRHLFSEADRDFLVAFADGAAVAIENARLYGEIEAARERLRAENESLRREILSSHHLGTLIGKSQAIEELKVTLERVAQSASTVLIRGESGTGKGLVARIIHNISARREKPFIHFNCAALPETLVESELFGHEKGAFTGAAGRKPGRFELAHQGTIFLDEIGKVSRAVQAKLLRVVEDKEFERVGGTKTLSTDVRIVAATNLDLEEAIARGEFREDLYYRLNIIPIVLPPLRERREDVPYLVQHFLSRIARDLGQPEKRLEPAVLDLFARHHWPGNVRELEAAIHRALVLAPGDTLTPADFSWIAVATGDTPPAAAATAPVAATLDLADGAYQATLEAVDRQLIEAALEQSDGKIREAARLLGIARNTLKSKIQRYGIEP